ncbi:MULTISPECIES: hypothetical protein [Mycolicibacter]|uniref:Uncharacterized protein n=2 Tax=Mycolicibacter TaxID=1073531 RepID=A0ABU5XKW9_9MYCO|nr:MULTISPECIES: hypothetical protein [unclassified Mycolicibacter]MEB3022930.1 hypothetical protein [Mycolicibacter sp. MYC098]MEB3034975.1 hypothetical protein [Mycolicibacter sp. MYC340]
MPEQSDRVAANLASLKDVLSAIGIEDDSTGEAAEAIRRVLADRGDHLEQVSAAASAVAQAAREREALVKQREATMPSEAEIQAAQEAVINSAGTSDEQGAIDRLADLLAQKRDAQKAFERGEELAADELETATRDLPSAHLPSAGNPAAAMGPLMGLLSSLSKVGTGAGGMPAAGEAAEAGAPTGFAPEEQDPVSGVLARLASGDHGGGGLHNRAFGEPDFADGAGQTHVAGSLVGGQQMPTLSGAVTGADVSGRGAAPFTVSSPPVGSAGSGGGMGGGGMPMMPPMGAGAGTGAGGGAAQGKSRDKNSIMNTDPDFTGADIDADIATSGVIGRGESQRHSGGGDG